MTSFDNNIEEKTKAMFDQIWVTFPRYNQTHSLNNIFASIQIGTRKKC